MRLTLDIGNTRTKAAVFSAGNNREPIFTTHTTDFNQVFLSAIFEQYPIQYAILSTVAEEPNELENWLKNHLNVYLKLSDKTFLPFRNAYATPATLGKDRLAGIAGARCLFPDTNVLVIDAGTCIKYDFMQAEGVYLGGSILPGIDMRYQALQHYTARLPLVDKALPDATFIGDSTLTAIRTGVQYGILHEANGFATQYVNKFGQLKVLLTGGDAEFFENRLNIQTFAEQNLVAIGLHFILNYNLLIRRQP